MTQPKLKLLICIDWFLPAYKAGGPIQSISNLVNHLKKEFIISIATSNQDLTETLAIDNSLLNKWQFQDGYKIIYLDRDHQNYTFYKKILLAEDFDALYLNSMFSFKFTVLPLVVFRDKKLRKVLAPRGMLGKGALRIKPLKKYLFLKLLKGFNVHKQLIWHATAKSEAHEIKKQFGNTVEIRLAPNLSAQTIAAEHSKTKAKGTLNVFFLSRIAIKKNLSGAIGFLSEIDRSYKIRFSIIGPVDEEGYWQACKRKLDVLPEHIEVHFLGAIPPNQLPSILKAQHVLLLPTQHENFGHVIMESWQNGCPVIISDQTPWKALENQRLGFDIPLSAKTKFVEAIARFASMDDTDFKPWSVACLNFAKTFTENPKLVEQNKALFLGNL